MRLQKRRIYKRRKRIAILFFAAVLLCGTIGSVFWLLQRVNARFISPVPFLISSSEAENSTAKMVRKELERRHFTVSQLMTGLNNTIIVTLESGEEVVLSADNDIQTQLSSLQLIHSRLTMEGKRFKKLDLRFDKPVITLSN